ncbi:MAG TPA: sigma-54 dependent transcriptional regulator [Candidatus Acidoferrales bacterium]|jgi:DNA-binding NtrC family response regulator|nr:sigma-54 dependent transcriptional regulator [Candidatus Acidoferrales bacterium]
METQKVLWISALRRAVEAGPGPLASPLASPPARWKAEFRAPEDGIEALHHNTYDAVVLDFPIPEWSPAEVLEQVRRLAPGTLVFIRDPEATLSDAVRLAHLGAYQFLEPGYEAAGQIEQAIHVRTTQGMARLAANLGRDDWERLLVGESHEMRQVNHLIRLVGSRRATVLITGETGTGKELAARALHLSGNRRTGPMVAVNCSAIPENLLEAELFGHVRGAFTGAIQSRIGRFEQAQGGTLFLDEIGDMPMELQAKLLRVLQEREVQRLGSSETIRLDIRFVAATNCDLAERIEQGRFREDLYYRLNVVPLHMPSLRQRPADIEELAVHFVEKVCRAEGIPAKTLTAEALQRLRGYSWPGNVRQLENAIETAVAMSGDSTMLAPSDFLLPLPYRARTASPSLLPAVCVPDDGLDYEQTLAVIEKSILEQALRKTGGNKKAAAEMLGLKRTTLSAKVRSLAMAAGCN